jgi:hypothetical protein
MMQYIFHSCFSMSGVKASCPIHLTLATDRQKTSRTTDNDDISLGVLHLKNYSGVDTVQTKTKFIT